MAYSELIKNFQRVREYMREFYIYGFKSRGEYGEKSARSYDNERRRVESWLSDYMSFHQDAGGKRVFLSVDSRAASRNPLYTAFKTKSFTANDIRLHFFLLDIFAAGEEKTVREIADILVQSYFSFFQESVLPDESTIRKKLLEYEKTGILYSRRRGREKVYGLEETVLDPESWQQAAAFFSEAAPLGVIGSYLLDRYDAAPDYFRFKHHYILQALDSQILYQCLEAIEENRELTILVRGKRMREEREHRIFPLKIYASTQTGRFYLLSRHYRFHKLIFFRLDSIRKVTSGAAEPDPSSFFHEYEAFAEKLWGVSTGRTSSTDHLELTIHVGAGENFIVERLKREKRNGRVERLDAHTYRFTADVYDATEMLPWLRTFIGRIIDLKCSNAYVMDTFRADLQDMLNQYSGGKDDVIQ